MFAELGQELDVFVNNSKAFIPSWLLFMAGLWCFNILNWLFRKPFNYLGIFPRRIYGLPGILFAPFLHGGFNHLFFNSIPLFILGLFLLAEGLVHFLFISAFIMVLSGLAVWLIGRRGNHIGASAVIAGYFGYILANVYKSPTFTSILLGLVALYYFGGILFSLFPTEESVSWEGHLTGFLAGFSIQFIIPYLPNYF